MLTEERLLAARPPGGIEESPAAHVLGQKLLRAWQHVVHGQHPNGEIVAFRRDDEGNHQYVRSPFVSTYVHDALGCFDADSLFFQPGSLGLLPSRQRQRFWRELLMLRRRIRSFLTWQQQAEGWWRFFGRGSGIDPDVATTANAAVALLQRFSGHWQAREQLQKSAVQRFRSASGRYYTFLRTGRGGYGWMDELGKPVAGFDRVVNAEVLRYLSLTSGPGAEELHAPLQFVLDELAPAVWSAGTPLFPNAASFIYGVARAWDHGGLPRQEIIRAQLLPAVLEMQDDRGAFGGPLATALCTASLLHLQYEGEPLQKACRNLLWIIDQDVSSLYEDFVVDGFGSPALTAALILDCLVRYHTRDGEGIA